MMKVMTAPQLFCADCGLALIHRWVNLNVWSVTHPLYANCSSSEKEFYWHSSVEELSEEVLHDRNECTR